MNIRLIIGIFTAFIIGLTACKKNDDAPTVITSIDSLNVINASADTVNFYLNGTRLNASNLYPGGSSGYYTVPSGLQTYQVKNVFNPASSVVKTLFSLPLTLVPHRYNSLFIGGESASQAFSVIDTLQADTAAGKCYVRFVNASPDGGKLDFAAGTVKFSGQEFKAASGFKQVDTASLKLIALYQSGSATPLISGHYPLLVGKSYTFYSKGKPGGTGNAAFSIGVTINYN